MTNVIFLGWAILLRGLYSQPHRDGDGKVKLYQTYDAAKQDCRRRDRIIPVGSQTADKWEWDLGGEDGSG